ncbi:26043_t:CDS:1, partial [Racocetra persica]
NAPVQAQKNENEPLFLPADKSERPANSTRSKKRYVEDSTFQDLLEEERTSD